MFKCNKKSCKFFRLGFAFRGQRDNHIKHHERQFKCSYPNCDFFIIGFISQTQLNHHRALCHPETEHVKQLEPILLNLDDVTKKLALEDAVSTGQATHLHVLLKMAEPLIPSSQSVLMDLFDTALRGKSKEIVEILFNNAEELINSGPLYFKYPWLIEDPFYEAAKGGSLDIAKWLISKGAVPNISALEIAVANVDIEMVQLLLSYDQNWKMDGMIRRFFCQAL